MNREELIKTLELVRPALSDSGLVPVFSCFVFEAEHVHGYNDVIGIKAPCNIGIGPCATNGKVLLDLLNASTSEDASFKLAGSELTVKAGKSQFKLPFLGKDDFLFEVPDEKQTCSATLGDDLIEGIKLCLITSSKDSSMPALMGVTFAFGPKGLTLYSCDGDGVSRYEVDGKSVKGTGIFTASNEFCEALVKAAEALEAEKTDLLFSDNWAIAALPRHDVRVYGRMVAVEPGKQLDHEKLIKDTIKSKQKPVPIPDGWSDALQRAAILGASEHAITTATCDGTQSIKLHTESSYGTAEDRLSIAGHGECECTIHAEHALKCSRLLENCMFSGNCCVYTKGSKVLVVCSNPDDNT